MPTKSSVVGFDSMGAGTPTPENRLRVRLNGRHLFAPNGAPTLVGAHFFRRDGTGEDVASSCDRMEFLDDETSALPGVNEAGEGKRARAERAAGDPQWERAHQAWSLIVHTERAALSPERERALYRVLRTKRFERVALLERLPGPVRRGAFVDLSPLEEELRRAGVDCELRRK